MSDKKARHKVDNDKVYIENQFSNSDDSKHKNKPSVVSHHPISCLIDKLISRCLTVKFSISKNIKYSERWLKKEELNITKKLKSITCDLKSNKYDNTSKLLKDVLGLVYRMKRVNGSELLRVQRIGHLLTIFSFFDSYMGDLIMTIYRKKPELFKQLNGTMNIPEMLKYDNVESIKELILKNEIEAFRRKSYVEQFTDLENRFKLNLKKFDNWPYFVECSQRRNIFTHCDGIVSKQYLTVCANENYPNEKLRKLGEKIELDNKYLLDSCDLIIEVGLKLGQTLWRKIFMDELKLSDEDLIDVQFYFLSIEDWNCAKMAGEYAEQLPHISSEKSKKIMNINYMIALKNCGEYKKLVVLLNNCDWSALSYDFRLAERVLRENYDDALDIMRRMGKKGDLVDEGAYRNWPLFNEFRHSEQFQEGFKEIYGQDFSENLAESALEGEQRSELSAAEEDHSDVEQTAEC